MNVKPWRATLPVVVQSVTKDMQCSIGAEGAAWIEDGQTVRIGNMVCSREPGRMSCAHLRAGHGFTISAADCDLW